MVGGKGTVEASTGPLHRESFRHFFSDEDDDEDDGEEEGEEAEDDEDDEVEEDAAAPVEPLEEEVAPAALSPEPPAGAGAGVEALSPPSFLASFFGEPYRSEDQPPPLSTNEVRLTTRSSVPWAPQLAHCSGAGSLIFWRTSVILPHCLHAYS